MKIEKKLLPLSIVELIVEESVEGVAKLRHKAIAYIEKNADIKGFRKGAKIPESLLVKQFGEEYIEKLTIDFAIDDMFHTALKKENLVPVAQGEIKEIISQSPLKIKLHIEVLPEAKIAPEYKKIKIKKQKVSVTDKEVEDALKDIQTRFTKYEEISDADYQVQMGDRVSIDTQGFENGNMLESTQMKNYALVLGTGILVPGFEESIVGGKKDANLEFPVVFPKDYHNNEFAGKNTTFKVTINKIEKAIPQEFTPEFIESIRGKKLDFDGFKALIKEELTEKKENEARLEDENKLIEEILKVTQLEIGTHMLAYQVSKVFDEIKANMSEQGVKMADYLENIKMSEDEYKEKYVKAGAIKRLQGELILHALQGLEKVDVSADELKTEITKIMTRFENPEVLKRLEELYVPGEKYYDELKTRISYRKLIDTFFE